MVGENGIPETPEWSLPPRTLFVPELPVFTIASAEVDALGTE